MQVDRDNPSHYAYLRSAPDPLDDETPIATNSDTVANRVAVVGVHLDPGKAQTFALTDVEYSRLLIDDGNACTFAKDQEVTIVGSVGVLSASIDAGKINEPTANERLSTWIDEIGYSVPYRTVSEYR